ncbi:MAG: hypothetical protein R6V49_10745, partial [Bacteroidales bacterium]
MKETLPPPRHHGKHNREESWKPRWFISLMIIGLLCLVNPWLKAQQTAISLSFSDTPLKEVLKEIEKQSDFTFAYNASRI